MQSMVYHCSCIPNTLCLTSSLQLLRLCDRLATGSLHMMFYVLGRHYFFSRLVCSCSFFSSQLSYLFLQEPFPALPDQISHTQYVLSEYLYFFVIQFTILGVLHIYRVIVHICLPHQSISSVSTEPVSDWFTTVPSIQCDTQMTFTNPC